MTILPKQSTTPWPQTRTLNFAIFIRRWSTKTVGHLWWKKQIKQSIEYESHIGSFVEPEAAQLFCNLMNTANTHKVKYDHHTYVQCPQTNHWVPYHKFQ